MAVGAQVPPTHRVMLLLALHLLGLSMLASGELSSLAPYAGHQDEEAIVINSVHSGLARKPSGGASSPPQQLAPAVNVALPRWPPSGGPTRGHQRPGAINQQQQDDRQEGRSGTAQHSQPSQEFDWQGGARHPTQAAASRRPQDATHRRPGPPNLQDSNLANFNHLSSAPYALSTATQQHQHQHQLQAAHHWTSNEPSSSATLIRDTSALVGDLQDERQDEQQQHSTSQNTTQWMQSVRDNHHGPLRSRFNLSWPVGGQPREPLLASMNADANRSGSYGPFAAYDQQQARSAASQQQDNSQQHWSRRNSKFTRQSTETTTSMPSSSSSSSSTTNTTLQVATTTTSSEPIGGQEFSGDGPAPINQTAVLEEERELMNSGQRFDTDLLVASSANSSLPEASTRRVDQTDQATSLHNEPNVTQSITANKTGSSMVLLNNNHSPPRAKLQPTASGKHKTGRRMSTFGAELAPEEVKTSQGWQALGGARRSWSVRQLPSLVQKTLGSVLRRLAGVQQQQQQQVQAAGMNPHQAAGFAGPSGGFGSSPSAGMNFLASALSVAAAAAASSARPAAGSVGEQMEGSTGGKLVGALQETREPPRQHANKKIIDSFIDLPVSERRLAGGEEARESPNRTAAAKIHSAIASAGSGKRRARNGSEWRRADGSGGSDYSEDEEEDRLPIEPRLAPDELEEDEAEEDEEGGRATARLADSPDHDELLEAASELEFRTTTEANNVDDYGNQDSLEAQDSQEQPKYARPPQEEELLQPQFYLYSPHSSMLRPLRRLNEKENDEEEEQHQQHQQQAEERRLPSLRRRRPPSWAPSDATATKRRKPLRPLLSVPPISLQSVARPHYHHHHQKLVPSSSTTTTTTTTTSTTIAPPSIQVAGTNSAMMSPMSSSINVMDLDPSMTQLAHNKLIVAKYKPKKSKRPTVVASTQLRHKRPSQHSLGATKGGSRQEATTAGPSTSIASTILGNQVLSNNHINDIINRWTKLASSSSTSTRPHQKQEETMQDLAEGLDGRIGLQAGASSRPTSSTSSPELAKVPEQWNATGSARSNYSLMSMNNRERINPLLLPLELSKFISPSNVSLASNKRQQQQQHLNRYSTAKQTSTTTTTTTRRPPTSSTQRPQRPTTSSKRPILVVNNHSANAANASEDEQQILIRSQHHTQGSRRPQPGQVNRVKLSEAERLRNQFHGITGVSSALDGRQAGVGNEADGEPTLKPTENISGHITLVTSPSALLAQDNLQEATNEANRYQLAGDENFGGGGGHEHSIVIMSDNHQTGKLKLKPTATVAPSMTTTTQSSLAAQLARKYLEEFVNGSRLRPSSVMAKTNQSNSDSQLWTRSSHQPPAITLNTNHAPPNQNATAQAQSNRRPATVMQQQQQQQQNLDLRAQALLQDVLDREPSYSDSFYAASKQKLGAAFYKSQANIDLNARRVNEEATKGSTSPAYEITHYAMTGAFSDGDSTIPEQFGSTTSDSPEPSTETSSSSSSTSSSTFDGFTTLDYAHLTPDSAALLREDTGNRDTNNRASMRRNQAMIQSILVSMAKKNNSRLQSEEDNSAAASSDNSLHDYSTAASSQTPDESSTHTLAETTTPGDQSNHNQSLYEPLKASGSRFPALKVETVGGTSRQKINKPLTPPTTDYSAGTTVAASSSALPAGGPTTPTTKLTESPTSDSLRQAIKNRINVNGVLYEATSTMAPAAADLASESILVDTMEPAGLEPVDESAELEAATDDEAADDQHHHNYPVPQLDDYQPPAPTTTTTTRRPPRPVIIRRRPRPQLVRRPEYLVVSGQQQKRRRKPARRPDMQLMPDSGEPQQRPYAPLPNVTVSMQLDESGEPVLDEMEMDQQRRRRRPLQPIVVHPRPELASAIIRKRPTYVRLPGPAPSSLRLPDSGAGYSTGTGKRRNRPALPPPAVNIILPMESIVKRPGQDVRTRPLTIIDPATEQPDLDGELGAVTRLPETTVVHNNMVVSYKPGRPLPPGDSAGTHAHLRPNHTTPMPDLSQQQQHQFGVNQSRPLTGDTHLVVIEGERPPPPPLSTTSTTPYPQRPIIIIQGLPLADGHQPATNASRPRPSTSSIVEAGSMTVLANAANNSSRPWYPTVSQAQSNQRHNGTGSHNISAVDLLASGSSGSLQLEANNNNNSSSSGQDQFSGSYQNHINHHQSHHIGMPYFPSGPNSGSHRPQQPLRPYKWRVKKRPNGGSSTSSAELQTAATGNSHHYRPIAPGSAGSLSQLLNANGLANLVDNVRILVARIRTFLISLMVMFLPPLSLAAAVASVMSSSA